MYKVMKLIHVKYGNVIEITRDDLGEFESPFVAFHRAKQLRRLWLEEGLLKVKILIDNQVLTVRQAEVWATEEYKSLPKCYWCVAILGEDVFTHRLSGEHLFCTQNCADKDYHSYIEKMCDEDDIDYI
jgi:hypothetical protein